MSLPVGVNLVPVDLLPLQLTAVIDACNFVTVVSTWLTISTGQQTILLLHSQSKSCRTRLLKSKHPLWRAAVAKVKLLAKLFNKNIVKRIEASIEWGQLGARWNTSVWNTTSSVKWFLHGGLNSCWHEVVIYLFYNGQE